jgi:hypothetical protein
MTLAEFEEKLRSIYGSELYIWHKFTDKGIAHKYFDEPECIVSIGLYIDENNFRIGPETVYYGK